MNTTLTTTTTDTTTTTGTPGSPRRRTGVTVAGLGLALALAAPLAAGPMAGVAGADPVHVTDPVNQLTQDDHGSHLHGKIHTTDGAALRLAGSPSLGEHTHAESNGELPRRIAASSVGTYQYSSDWGHEADMTFRYAIGDGTWEVWTHTNVPVAGPNVLQAEIRRYGQSHSDPDSPFNVTVSWSSTSSYNPEPDVSITRKPGEVVTDRAEQASLLTRFCKGGTGACDYVPKSYVPDTTQAPVNVSHPYYNDTKEESEFGFDQEISTKWINSIAVEGSVEVEIAKVVSLGVKVTYEHSVEREYKTVEKMSTKVAPGEGVVYQFMPSYAKVSGDFSIYAEGTRYDLKNVDFDFPTGGTLHAVPLPPHH